MNKITITLLLTIATIASSCNKNELKDANLEYSFSSDTIELKINAPINLDDTKTTILFTSVIEDSRCPADVQCGWEGNAKVGFILHINQSEYNFSLNTHGGDQMPSDTTINGYRFSLVGLNPYPTSTTETKSESYIAYVYYQPQK